ncbi:MAG: hypothetical protein AAF985_09475 [Bacteroidota bacterium]
MNRSIFTFFLLCILILPSCYNLPEEGDKNPWETVNLSTITPIRTMFASPLELLVATDDEFYRINTDNEIVEKRNIGLPFRHFGRPAISDFVTLRLVRTATESQVAELHLTRNADEVYNFSIADIPTNGEENFEVEGTSRNPGAFNFDGSQFLLPVRTLTSGERYFSFFLLDIDLNSTKTEFQSVEIAQRIDIVSLPGDPATLVNVKFINGFYYVTSQNGAFRISPSGDAVTLFTGWMQDVFELDGKLYITGFNDFEFYTSSDNGASWERVLDPTTIKMVEVANDEIFFHQAIGFRFKLADTDLKDGQNISLNEDFPTNDFAAYSNIVYFFGNYYLSVQKEIAFSSAIQTEE